MPAQLMTAPHSFRQLLEQASPKNALRAASWALPGPGPA